MRHLRTRLGTLGPIRPSTTGRALRCPGEAPPDSTNPSTMSLAEYNHIKNGMRQPQVAAIVGAPPAFCLGLTSWGTQVSFCIWNGESSLGETAQIGFKNGAVEQKAHTPTT